MEAELRTWARSFLYRIQAGVKKRLPSQDRTSAKELKEVGEGYHDSMTLYFEEGFADGQNGRAELTQEPRTSILIQQREDGSTYEKNLRVVAHKDQWRAAPSVEAEER
ncbi:hypothetical protein BC827DRAFT_1157219 [Russula dissimulans]|nr:hypothetical protein BC827DRAFT_1157219 [Russula dissimulans]